MKKTLTIATAALLAVGLSGCANDTKSDHSEGAAASSPAATTSETTAAPSASTTSAAPSPVGQNQPFADTDAALAAIAAAQQVANGTVMEVDRDDRDQVWKIHVLEDNDEVKYLVDASGKVTEKDRDTVDQEDAMRILGAVPLADAVKAAREQVSDGYLDEVEIDNQDGQIVYVVSFDDTSGNDYKDVHLDPQTGKVITVKEYR